MSTAAQPEHPRHYPNTFPPGLPLSPNLAHEHLEHLVKHHPPSPSAFPSDEASGPFGLFSGPTSFAYLFFTISQPPSKYATVPIAGTLASKWCLEYLDCAAKVKAEQVTGSAPLGSEEYYRAISALPNPWNCGIYNEELTWNTVMAIATQEQQYVDVVLSALPQVLTEEIPCDKNMEGGLHEWLGGRAGYLYLLRVLKHYFNRQNPSTIVHSAVAPNQTAATLQDVMDKVIDRILANGPSQARPWAFAFRLYLGLAHGWIGIITQILLSSPSSQDLRDTLRPLLHRILDAQLPNGNWPAFVPDETEPKPEERHNLFFQIGHGGPGVVVSLMALRERVFVDNVDMNEEDRNTKERIDQAITRAQDVIWEKGLLTKEPCLQHGAPGNALALTDKARVQTFLARSTMEVVDEGLKVGYELEGGQTVLLEPGSSSGVHRGVAGRAWAFWMWEEGRWGKGELLTYTDV